jgi:hypothetical protein
MRRSPQPVASLTLGAYRIVSVGYKPRNNRMYLHQQTPHARKMHDLRFSSPPICVVCFIVCLSGIYVAAEPSNAR